MCKLSKKNKLKPQLYDWFLIFKLGVFIMKKRVCVIILCTAFLLSACATPTTNTIKAVAPEAIQAKIIRRSTTKKAVETPKEPVITIDSDVEKGEMAVLRVTNAKDLEVSAKTNTGFTPVFYNIGDEKIALLPISYNANVGTYELTITVGKDVHSYSLNVKDRVFVEQYLTVDSATTSSTIESDEANKEWAEKIEPLKAKSDPEKYWDGAFIQPVSGKITTEFGMARYTNGSKTPSRHSGIDIASPLNTPVPAANNGKVIFAGYLKLTGNTVVIEHGLGLKSWYYHMNSLSTKEGTMVKKGDIVGKVGSTGFSTGPHLHYAMSVNNVFTNPWTAFETGYSI